MRRPKKQKFMRYDLVQITDEMPRSMSHFRKGCRAVVRGSYTDEYGWGGSSGRKQYSLVLEGPDGGFGAWYEEDQLTLIEPNRPDLYEQWDDTAGE